MDYLELCGVRGEIREAALSLKVMADMLEKLLMLSKFITQDCLFRKENHSYIPPTYIASDVKDISDRPICASRSIRHCIQLWLPQISKVYAC